MLKARSSRRPRWGRPIYRKPTGRDASPFRGDRDLGQPPGDERREDYAERPALPLACLAGEHEPQTAPRPLDPGRNTRVGRLEEEAVASFDPPDPFAKPAGQREEFVGGGACGDASPEPLDGMRRQGRREVEPAGFQFEEGVCSAQENAVRPLSMVGPYPSSTNVVRPCSVEREGA